VAQAGGDHARLDAVLFPRAANAFGKSGDIGLRRQPGIDRVVGGNEELGIDRALGSEIGKIGFGEQRVIILARNSFEARS
jgi:hypothetical protein